MANVHIKVRAFLKNHTQRQATKLTRVNQATFSRLANDISIKATKKTKRRLKKIGVEESDWTT